MKMKCQHLTLFALVLILSLFISSHGSPIPKKGGRRKAFGGGLLTGVLAGAVVGNVLTNRAHSSKSESNKHVTTVQNGPISPNGCFEQTVREFDTKNSKKFVETVNLVCPSNVPISIQTPVSAVVPTPIQPAVVHTTFAVPAPAPTPQTLLIPAQVPAAQSPEAIGTQTPHIGFVDPSSQQMPQPMNTSSTISPPIPQLTIQNPAQIVPQAPVQQNPHVNSHVHVTSQQNPHVHTHAHVTSQQIPQQTVHTVTPHTPPNVYVLSKRTEYYNKKKSSGISRILGNTFLVYISIILVMLIKYLY